MFANCADRYIFYDVGSCTADIYCKMLLSGVKMKELDNTNFDDFIKNNAIIDFSADWCMPCKMLKPILEELSEEFKNISFGKVDTDNNLELAKKYNINALPTVLFFKNGDAVNKMVGLQSKNAIKTIISNTYEVTTQQDEGRDRDDITDPANLDYR